MAETPFHLVVRFSDNMFSVGDVVGKHNDIVAKFGAVWFGKMGTTISQTRIELLNNQVLKGIPTYVYLVKGNRKKSTPYKANMLSVAREFPKKEKTLIPNYYSEKGLLEYINVWMKLGQIEPIEITSLKNFSALSSIFPLVETLARSSSGYFLVREGRQTY